MPHPATLRPGPFLAFDSALAKTLIEAVMLPDRLSNDAWLLLPNDRLRVREDAAADCLLKLEASAAPAKYRTPNFASFLLDGGQTIPLSGFGPEATLSVPLSEARMGAGRIDIRDGRQGRTAERVTISKVALNGLQGRPAGREIGRALRGADRSRRIPG